MGGLDDFTKVLLHFDGANGSTTIIDELGHSFSVEGDAQISTAQSKFGGSSLYCDGTNDRVYAAHHADFSPGTEDFCAEAWGRIDAINVQQWLYGKGSSASADKAFDYAHGGSGNGSTFAAIYANGALRTAQAPISTIAALTWYHFATIRYGSTLYNTVNGVVKASVAVSTWSTSTNSSQLSIGALGNYTSYRWAGYIDEFRLSIGTARYTSFPFTPPTEAFSDERGGNQACSGMMMTKKWHALWDKWHNKNGLYIPKDLGLALT